MQKKAENEDRLTPLLPIVRNILLVSRLALHFRQRVTSGHLTSLPGLSLARKSSSWDSAGGNVQKGFLRVAIDVAEKVEEAV